MDATAPTSVGQRTAFVLASLDELLAAAGVAA
jgi:hypothetical protein